MERFDAKNIRNIAVLGHQGSGKTTTIGKLANYLRKNNKKKPFLTSRLIKIL